MTGNSAPVRLLEPVGPRDHAQGPADASVTLVEYGDYECPYCGRAFPSIKKLQQEFGDQLRVVFRHFPQNSVHPHASVAAQAAEAAAAQGKFWQMHDLLLEHQDELADADLAQYALRAGLEVYRFEADMSSERFAARVGHDHEAGVKNGVKKTPTLFLNSIRYDGPLEYEPLAAAVRATAERSNT